MEVGDREGEDIENWMAVSGAELGNTGTNTYKSNQGNDAESALDLSFSTGNIKIRDWKGEKFIFSDHRPITFLVEWRDPDGLTERERTTRQISKYSYKIADWSKFNKVFHIAYINYKGDSSRSIRERVKYSKRSWKVTSKPRTEEVELENTKILSAFRAAARTTSRM